MMTTTRATSGTLGRLYMDIARRKVKAIETARRIAWPSSRAHRDSVAGMYRVAAAAWLLAMTSGCGKKHDPPAKRSAAEACFDTHGRTSAAAKPLFDRRRLQGGGPTWRSILEVVVRRHATIVGPRTDDTAPAAPEGEFRDAYQVRYGRATTWFSTDEEGDGVRFCAGDAGLVRDVSGDFERLNADPLALAQAVDQANGIE
jgi:hypothetical protein